jgi:hypothetical protein
MVKVHHFKIWNQSKGDWEIPPSKRTSRSIIELNGTILPGSAEEIDPDQLDSQGRFFPPGATLFTPVKKLRQKYSKNIINEKLDNALEQSFPASDPVAVGRCSHMRKSSRQKAS